MHEERVRQLVDARERSRYKAEQFVREVKNLTPVTRGRTHARIGALSIGDGSIGYELEFKDPGQPVELHFIRDHNVPLLVPDSTGPVVRDKADGRVDRYREDLPAALRAMVRDYIRLRSVGRLHGTDTFYAANNTNGTVLSTDATYSTARAGGTLSVLSVAAQDIIAGEGNAGPPWQIWEGDLDFDTSAIPDANDVSSAFPSLYGVATSYALGTWDFRMRIWSPGTLGTEDYVAGANMAALDQVRAKWTPGTWSTSAYNDWDDVALAAAVSKTGSTRLFVHSRRTEDGGGSGGSVIKFFASDEAGTTKDPKLTVTHAAPGGGGGRSSAIIIG